jgi:hypothetical protein
MCHKSATNILYTFENFAGTPKTKKTCKTLVLQVLRYFLKILLSFEKPKIH